MPTHPHPHPHPRPPASSGGAMREAARALVVRMGPYAAMWITLAVGGVFVVLMTAAAAEIYESVVESDDLAGLDHPLLAWMMSMRSSGLNTAATWFTNTGDSIGMTLIALLAIAGLTWSSRSWRPLILIAAAAAGSLCMTIAGKALIGRVRPPLVDAVPPYESSASFPSGHTLNATAILAVIAYLCFLELERRSARVGMIAGCAAYVFLMGLSRVFLGHHWFTDVVVAWVLGLAWAALVVLAHRVFHTVRRVRREARVGTVPGGGHEAGTGGGIGNQPVNGPEPGTNDAAGNPPDAGPAAGDRM